MTVAMQPSLNKGLNDTTTVILDTGVWGAVGYLYARTYTALNPMNIGLFAGAAKLISYVTNPIFESIFSGAGSSKASKFLGQTLNTGSSIAIAKGVAHLLGYSISYSLASTLFLTMIAVSLISKVGLALAVKK